MARRRKGVPPPYLHDKTNNQAYSRLHGRKTYHGIHGTSESRANYKTFIGEWEASQDGRQSPAPPRGRPCVGDVVEMFLACARKKYVREDGSPSPEVRSFVVAFKPLMREYRHLDADEFRAKHLMAIRDSEQARGLHLSTINKNLGRLVRAWKWALSHEHLTHVSAAAVVSLQSVARLAPGEAPENEPVEPVEDWVVEATLPYVSRQVGALIRLQMACGMRPGEACAIRGAEIDRDGKAHFGGRVMREEGVWMFAPRQQKNRKKASKKVRYLVYLLGPQAQALLEPWLRADPEEHLFRPCEAREEWFAQKRKNRKSKVQPSQANRAKVHATRLPGCQYTTASYDRAIAQGVKKANRAAERKNEELREAGLPLLPEIPHWSPNQLRHRWVTRVELEEGIETTSKAIGHTSVDTTQIYVKKRIAESAEIARKHG